MERHERHACVLPASCQIARQHRRAVCITEHQNIRLRFAKAHLYTQLKLPAAVLAQNSNCMGLQRDGSSTTFRLGRLEPETAFCLLKRASHLKRWAVKPHSDSTDWTGIGLMLLPIALWALFWMLWYRDRE
jgi:hypothetical protein